MPDVKNRVHFEMKKLKDKAEKMYAEARQVYVELLEFVNSRYNADRKDCPARSVKLTKFEKQQIVKLGLKRMPVELERRFMDILMLLLKDDWTIPEKAEWMDVLEFLDAFDVESPIFVDSPLRDCYHFF